MNASTLCDETIRDVNPLTISNRHINQLVDLVITTDPFQCYAKMNRLSSSAEFAKADFTMPYIQHTKMMLDELNNIAGFYAALTKAHDAQIVKDRDWNQDDPNVSLLFNAENTLFNHVADSDYFLSIFAIRPDLHGVIHPKYNKKISLFLFEELLRNAYESNSNYLAIITWESHVAAIKLYSRYGGEIVQSIDLSHSIFSDKLILMKIRL